MAFSHLIFLNVLFFAIGCQSQEAADCPLPESDESDEQSAIVIAQSVSRASQRLPSFASFIAEHQRSYTQGSEEYEMRQGLFEQRVTDVSSHNTNANRRWNAGINHMADRTDAELSQLRGLSPFKRTAVADIAVSTLEQNLTHISDDEKSWAHLHAIKAHTDQAHCGSCWAVATMTMLRANAEIHGHHRTFSPQELIDCVPNPHHCGGTGGCKGSTVELALNWVMEKGLDTLEDTPYKGKDSSCKKRSASLLAQYGHQKLEDMIAVGFHGARTQTSAGLKLGLRGWERLPENEYQPLLHAVSQTGPVAISVAARPWHFYQDGIFDGCKPDAVVDHAVVLIGYGKDKKTSDKYWLIKNSWGPEWGEAGNIRMLRHEGNVHCGTDQQPEVGTGCDGGPSEVRVCGMCGILYDSVVPYFGKKTSYL